MTSFMRLCPQCRKVSPVSEATWHSVCSHCGFLFFPFMERRSALRLRQQCPAVIMAGDDSYEGHTLNLSESGIKLRYNGRLFEKGNILGLTVENLAVRRKAEVVWSDRQAGDAVCAGLRFL